MEFIFDEDVMNIIDLENPDGVLVQFGGHTQLNIAKKLPRSVCKYKTKGNEPKIINILIVNSIFTLLYFPIDISDVEKPPVASVVIEWAIESKVGIPNIQRSKAQSIVKKKYINPIMLAIWPALGKTFSDASEDSV